MKKLLGLTVAMALLVPVGLMAAPGGAAAAGTSCKPPAGKITLKPGLSNTPTVQTISINLPLTGCKGGGVTGGKIVGSVKTTKITIASFLTTTTPTNLKATITWNTKATSSFIAATTVKVGKGKITATIKGKISAGLFKGLTALNTTAVTPGATVNGKQTSATVKGLTALTIK